MWCQLSHKISLGSHGGVNFVTKYIVIVLVVYLEGISNITVVRIHIISTVTDWQRLDILLLSSAGGSSVQPFPWPDFWHHSRCGFISLVVHGWQKTLQTVASNLQPHCILPVGNCRLCQGRCGVLSSVFSPPSRSSVIIILAEGVAESLLQLAWLGDHTDGAHGAERYPDTNSSSELIQRDSRNMTYLQIFLTIQP